MGHFTRLDTSERWITGPGHVYTILIMEDFHYREEVQTTTETTETPEIKTKTVEDVKKAVEEAEKVRKGTTE